MRHMLILDLKDDPELIARYEAWHAANAVPKPVIQSIRGADITAMDIYRSGNRLVMVMETGPNFDPAAKAGGDRTNPDVLAWEELMDQFQQRLPWAPEGVKWVEAQRIFSLDEQD
jgi:L-rhamnose mutarotase